MELVSTSDCENALELLDRCFPVEPGHRFIDDFPIWTNLPQPNLKLFGVKDGERVVAIAGARTCLSRVNEHGAPIQIGMIGAVATDAEFRGRGLASNVVEEAVNWLDRKGARTQFLWGSDHALYEKFGFTLGGQQLHVPLAAMDFGSATPTHANLRIESGFRSRIFEQQLSKTSGVVHSEEDRVWWCDHRNVQWFTLEDKAAQTFAYLGFGRGIDLKDTIHEWGGNLFLLSRLLTSLQNTHPQLSILIHPQHLKKCGWTLKDEIQVQSLAMIRNPDSLPTDAFWFWGLDAI